VKVINVTETPGKPVYSARPGDGIDLLRFAVFIFQKIKHPDKLIGQNIRL
jgi:hypothetical protein